MIPSGGITIREPTSYSLIKKLTTGGLTPSLALLIFAAVLAAYSPALRGGMVWDDDAHVTRADLRPLHGLERIWFEVGATQQYYPVLHSAFWIEHRLWGDATFGYHLVNALLHATAACLFVVILARLSVPCAWLAGLIFALHPVCVESVAWISEQKNTLSAVFYLLAALAYLRFDKERGQVSEQGGASLLAIFRDLTPSYWLATALFVLALLTKSVTASLPAALLVVLWWKRGSLSLRRDAVPLVPWFVMGGAAGLFTAWVERRYVGAHGAVFELNLLQRFLLAGRVCWFYFGKLFWPSNLVFIYPRWEIAATAFRSWLCPAALIAVLIALWLLRRKSRGPLAAALFFIGSLFPALGFFNVYPFIYSFVADHFQYLASMGMVALAAGAWGRWGQVSDNAPRWRSIIRDLAPFLVVGTLGVLTWRQSRMYRDLETLYLTTIDRNPGCWMAYSNLGTLLLEKGQPAAAAGDLTRALQLKPDYPEGEFNLANALRAEGRYPDAILHYGEALRLKPDYPEALDNLGTALAGAGRTAEAVASYREALRLRPDYAEAEVNLGTVLQKTSPGAAIACYERALQIRPDDPEAEYDLGIALRTVGRLPEAITHYEAALRLRPGFSAAHNNLGVALVEAGRLDDAIGHYEQALRLRPDDAEFEDNLGVALARAGRLPEAIAHFEQALRLKPDYRAAHFNLSIALRDAGRTEEAIRQYRQAVAHPPPE